MEVRVPRVLQVPTSLEVPHCVAGVKLGRNLQTTIPGASWHTRSSPGQLPIQWIQAGYRNTQVYPKLHGPRGLEDCTRNTDKALWGKNMMLTRVELL